jgi:hemolysin activation/secretion protein
MSRSAKSFVPLALVAALAPLTSAIAQTVAAAPVPNAGEFVRDLPAGTAMPALPDAAATTASGAKTGQAPAVQFVLRRLEVKGATVFTPQQLDAIAEPWVGKPVGEAELAALMGTLRKRYEDRGYGLASLGFPSQDVGQGVLRVDVVEPKLGRVQLPLGVDAPVTEARIRGLMGFFNLEQGGVLNTAALERVMFALNDMPGVQAKAALSPSGDEGVYNLSIQVTPRRSGDASLSLDNHGVGYAGRWRGTGVLRLNNPLGIGDNVDLQTMLSTGGGVKVGRLAYEWPVAYTPARLAVGYAKVDYALGGQYSSADAHGTAEVAEANLSYPLMRSRSRTLMARLGYESKALTDYLYQSDTFTSKKHVNAVLAGLNYESRDGLWGGGFNGLSAQFHWGRLNLKSEIDQLLDGYAGDYGKAGSFGKVELQWSRLQAVSKTVSLYASLSQQLATRNLDSAEKMTLGGPRGVRAYPTAEGSSDEATLFNGELRYWLNRNWTVFALYDWAKGRRMRDTTPDLYGSNDIQLRGAGLGVAATFPDWVTLKATVAWRGERQPETTTSHDKARVFVQAQHTF